MIESISAITLAIHDMQRSVRFYTALGFEIVHGGATSSFTSFRAGSGYLNVIAQPQEKHWSWWGPAIFYVGDVDAMYRRALAAGFTPSTTPRDAEWGERYFHLTDPDDHEFNFARPLRAYRNSVAATTRRAKHPTSCQAPFAKIFLFPKGRTYDLTKPPRPDMRDVTANRHETSGGLRWTRKRAGDAC